MKVCETIIESGNEIVKCFEVQTMPAFSDEARDALIMIVLSCFFCVFAVKIAQRLFFGA